MKTKWKNCGCIWLTGFVVWTGLIRIIDVCPVGANGTDIGFATFNCWFHELTGVHMSIYYMTDWLGLIPVFVCVGFGMVGLIQLIKRKSIFKVDRNLIILGIYYVIVILAYLIFEMIPVNYRPILIEGRLEASYPSSTTLLVLCVMPTLLERVKRRWLKIIILCFTVFMVIGRLISGVHWFTDIAGAIMLSAGLYCIYRTVIVLCCKDKN